MEFGSFKLASTENLPNAFVAFPGEHWSDVKASETIVPGELVTVISSGGRKYARRATSAEAIGPLSGLALRTVDIPDSNNGSAYSEALGPNEITNLSIAAHEYIHMYHSGSFHLTLITPDADYVPGDLIRWDPTGVRPTGKAGVGSWTRDGATAANASFVVEEWRPIPDEDTEGILTVRSVRNQF